MLASISSGFGDIKTQQVLTSQVVLNSLENRRQINAPGWLERTFRISGQKIFSAGLFCQVAKTFCRLTNRQMAVSRLKERQVYHVERHVVPNCVFNNLTRLDPAGIVEPVADQNDDATFPSIPCFECLDGHRGRVKYRRVLVGDGKVESFAN